MPATMYWQTGDGRCDRRSVRCRPTHHWQAEGRRWRASLAWRYSRNGAEAYPPTPAMKRFADSLVRQKGIKASARFRNPGKLEPKPVNPGQLLYAKKIAQGKGLVIPDEAKASSPPFLRGLTRTEERSAASAVARPT